MAPAIFAAQSEQYSFLLAVMMYQSCPLESSRLQPAQRSASAVPKNLTADLHDIFMGLMVAPPWSYATILYFKACFSFTRALAVWPFS